jgi:hypothetical protein
VARNYKVIVNETRGFVNEVALRLSSHCDLLKAADADKKEVKKRLKEEQEQKEFRVNAREGGDNYGGDGISITNTVNAKARLHGHSPISIESCCTYCLFLNAISGRVPWDDPRHRPTVPSPPGSFLVRPILRVDAT